MNPQPVSLADELRGLVEKWCEHKPYRDDEYWEGVRAFGEAISALLRQHAVAEPPSEKWHGFIGGLNGNPEFCKYCGEPEQSYRHAPAHAAEQPKLTEEMVKRAWNESDIVNELTWEPFTKRLNAALLTSPVAPGEQPLAIEPMDITDDEQAALEEIIADRHAPPTQQPDKRTVSPADINESPTEWGRVLDPPIAMRQEEIGPFLQGIAHPPAPVESETCECGNTKRLMCEECFVRGFASVKDKIVTPPAQERASDEVRKEATRIALEFARPEFRIRAARAINGSLATAAKQAREEAARAWLQERIDYYEVQATMADGCDMDPASFDKRKEMLEAELTALAAQPSPQKEDVK